MSPHEEHECGRLSHGPATSRARGLRRLPGFTTAAVVFVVIVLLGAGGVAIANWNQSATATIDITAGAAPVPSPTPTPTPTPTVPPAGPGNIVVNPVIAARPATLDAETLTCSSPGNSGKFTFNWGGDPASGVSYVVSLKSQSSATVFLQTQTVSQKTVMFTLDNKPASFGEYILRVQPMNGSVAGDPIYRTFRYAGMNDWGCYYASPAGQSPLGTLVVTAAPIAPAPSDNILNLTWTGTPNASRYVVSVKSKTSSYGAEFTTTSPLATLTFPPRVRDQWGNPTNSGPYFSDYTIRIQPMTATTAGDPVYKVIRYYANSFTVGDN